MIRAPFCDVEYWDTWIKYTSERIERMESLSKEPAANPSYAPQYAFQIVKMHWKLMLLRYSRGDSSADLLESFSPLLGAWEESQRLHLELFSIEQYRYKFDWSRNLDHYIICFWLTGLALALEIADDQWERLVVLFGNEGKDHLLDRVIATKQPSRAIGSVLCHPLPYERLLKVIDSTSERRASLLVDFVESWYPELDRSPTNKKLSEDTAVYERPYWYKFGETNMEGGAYFGQWCIEAVAVVKAFGIDDQQCVGHPQYPGDLLRPGQVTEPDLTRLPNELRKWKEAIASKTSESADNSVASSKDVKAQNWLNRFFSRK